MKQIMFLLLFLSFCCCVKQAEEVGCQQSSVLQKEGFYPYIVTTTKVAFYDDKGVEIGYFEQPVVWEWRESQGGRYYPIRLGNLAKCFKRGRCNYTYAVLFGEIKDRWEYGVEYVQFLEVGIGGKDWNLKADLGAGEKVVSARATIDKGFGRGHVIRGMITTYDTKRTKVGSTISAGETGKYISFDDVNFEVKISGTLEGYYSNPDI